MGAVGAINTKNLRIARENVRLTTQYVSGRISSVDRDVVADWEAGEALPTWSQLSKLAKAYDVSEFSLLADEALPKNKAIPDFRTARSSIERSEVGINKLINLVLARQRWLEDTLTDADLKKNVVQGSGKNIVHSAALADFIAKTLDIDLNEIKGFSGKGARKKALDYIIQKAEQHNIFIGKTISFHRIEVEDMRGLFVSNDYYPFIVINRGDSLSAQIFSIIHELAHLFRKSDSISNSLEFRTGQGNQNREEIFCNQVAADFLLPIEDFTKRYYEKADIDDISILYKVSPIAIFYRLKELGKIRIEIEDELERQIKRETSDALKIKNANKGNGGDYNNAMRDSNGALFNKVVSNFYLSSKLNYVEASGLLKFNVEKA